MMVLRWRSCHRTWLHLLFFCLVLWQFFFLVIHRGQTEQPISHNRRIQNVNRQEDKSSTNDDYNVVFYTDIPINRSEEPWVDTWLEVKDSSDGKAFVFSAYFEEAGRLEWPSLRIITVLKTRRKKPLHCRMKSKEGKISYARGSPRIIREHWNLKYSAFQVVCRVPDKFIPITVSLVENQRALSFVLNVHQRPVKKPAEQFAVCVKPLHYNYNRAAWFVEFVEFYRLMGVTHFYLYNHSVGNELTQVLHYYKNAGLVTILPWQLNVRSQKEIRTEGLFAALNDCLYRVLYRFQFAAMVDFDEFLVPRKHSNFYQLVHHLQKPEFKTPLANVAAYVFKNAFFYLYWENDTDFQSVMESKSKLPLPYLLTLYKTRRLIKTHNYGVRSKFLVVPEAAFEVGNHQAARLLSGRKAFNVPEEFGLSHHYRICEYGGFECLKNPSVVDRSAIRFTNEIISRVLDVCRQVFVETGQCPEAPPLGSPW